MIAVMETILTGLLVSDKLISFFKQRIKNYQLLLAFPKAFLVALINPIARIHFEFFSADCSLANWQVHTRQRFR